MSLSKGKHNIAEIEGVRCTVVETGVTEERAEFLKNMLTFNGYEVKMEKEKAKDGTELESCLRVVGTAVDGVTALGRRSRPAPPPVLCHPCFICYRGNRYPF